jgi:hypothetical protein
VTIQQQKYKKSEFKFKRKRNEVTQYSEERRRRKDKQLKKKQDDVIQYKKQIPVETLGGMNIRKKKKNI